MGQGLTQDFEVLSQAAHSRALARRGALLGHVCHRGLGHWVACSQSHELGGTGLHSEAASPISQVNTHISSGVMPMGMLLHTHIIKSTWMHLDL